MFVTHTQTHPLPSSSPAHAPQHPLPCGHLSLEHGVHIGQQAGAIRGAVAGRARDSACRTQQQQQQQQHTSGFTHIWLYTQCARETRSVQMIYRRLTKQPPDNETPCPPCHSLTQPHLLLRQTCRACVCSSVQHPGCGRSTSPCAPDRMRIDEEGGRDTHTHRDDNTCK